MTTTARFWERVERTPTCWEWLGAKDKRGYGRLEHDGRMMLAHRVAFGPVPDGLELDHLCRNPGCVRPDHLEAVTHAENVRRGRAGVINNWQRKKTQCPHGHDLVGGNVYLDAKGWRHCRTCRNDYMRRWRERRAGAA